jgi:hypothetical protein
LIAMRHLIAVALLLTTLAATACTERGTRGTSGAYVGGGAGGNVARDR